ncbi:hypothetical protein ES708_21917 [subsurface metagenome]
MKHKVTLSDEELKALILRVEVLSPMEFDLETFSILRNLYARFQRILSKGG